MSDTPLFRLDDLRRFASGLAAGVGLPPPKASALASQLLWFETAGAPRFGVAALPGLLERVAAGRIDPGSDGVVTAERGATAVFDGRHGVPLLVLDRAAGLATEKARETGVGLVRVANLEAPGSSAPIAAEMAVGPYVGLVVGPGASWSIAMPAEGGLPAVFDTELASGPTDATPRRGRKAPPPPALASIAGPLARILAPGDGCLVVAVAVTALEALAAFHERLADAIRGLDETEGRLLPGPWEARRVAARGNGISLDPATRDALNEWSARLGVPPPGPAA